MAPATATTVLASGIVAEIMGSAAAERSESRAARLAFTWRLEGDDAVLELRDAAIATWLVLETLELALPGAAAAADPGGSPEQFQTGRGRARSAVLAASPHDLERGLRACAAELDGLGISRFRASLADGFIHISAFRRDGDSAAQLSSRLYIGREEGRLRLTCTHTRVYGAGASATIAPLAIHRLIEALLGTLWPTSRAAAERLGVGDFAVDGLRAALFRLLPRAGWRLPRLRDLGLESVRISPSGLRIGYALSTADVEAAADERVAALRGAEHYRPLEDLLLAGDEASALRGYRAELDRAAEDDAPFIAERVLAIASSRGDASLWASEVARQALDRWPSFGPAHAALATLSLAAGDMSTAADHYRRQAESASASGDEGEAVQAMLACAHILGESDAARTAAYEWICARDPGHPEASAALEERYRADGSWHDLAHLLRARAGSARDPDRRRRWRRQLASVLSLELGDHDRARGELRLALEESDDDPALFEALADLELAHGSRDDGLRALDSAAFLHATREDPARAAAIWTRAADLCQAAGDLERAHELYRRALLMDNDDRAARGGAARTAAARGDHEEAAIHWRHLYLAEGDVPRVRADYACRLGLALTLAGRRDEARPPLDFAAGAGDGKCRVRALRGLTAIDAAAGDNEEAIRGLGAAIEAVWEEGVEDGELAAELELERAALFAREGCAREASFGYRRAFELFGDDHPARALAAESLLEGERLDDHPDLFPALLEHLDSAEHRVPLRIRWAHGLADSGELESALAHLEAALGEDVGAELRRETLWQKAALLRRAGRAHTSARAEAMAARAELTENDDDKQLALAEAAEAWLDAAELDRASKGALDVLQTAHRSAPAWRRAATVLGECAWRRRDWDDIDACYARLLEDADIEPRRAEFAYRHGLALEKLGRDLDAIETLRLLTEEPSAPRGRVAEAWHLLGALYDRRGDSAAAAAAFEAYAIADPLSSRVAQADGWYRAGELHRKMERGAEAIRCLETALQLADDHFPALDALERVWRDEPERLAVILGRKVAATASQPQRQRALLLRLAGVQLELGRRDVAKETFLRVLEIAPGDRRALHFVGRDCQSRGDFPRAALAFASLLDAPPSPEEPDGAREERLEIARELADIFVATAGDLPDETLRSLERATAGVADRRIVRGLDAGYRRRGEWAALADLLGRRAELEEGKEALALDLERLALLRDVLADPGALHLALHAARERNPRAAELREVDIDLDIGRGDATVADVDQGNEAEGNEAEGNEAEGNEAEGNEAEDNEEEDSDIPSLAAAAAALLRDRESALARPRALLEALEAEPDAALIDAAAAAIAGAPVAAERARLHHRLGQLCLDPLNAPDLAATCFERALEDDAAHPGALDELAELALLRGDWPTAELLFGRIRPESSAHSAGWLALRRGEVAEMLAREREAVAWFSEAVDRSPDSREALAALSRASLRVGDITRAIEAQQAIIDMIPTTAVEELRGARLALADLCQRSGETTLAIYYFERVLADEPRSVTALSNLLALYSGNRDPIGASRVLRALIALTPSPTQRADLLFRLGELIASSASDRASAADAYFKAIDLDPDHLPTLRRLLTHYWRAGDSAGVDDMIQELSRRGALLSEATDRGTLGRAALHLALRGDFETARAAAGRLGDERAETLGKALIEAQEAGRDSAGLARAAHELSSAGAGERDDLIAFLQAKSASAGEAAERLAAELQSLTSRPM